MLQFKPINKWTKSEILHVILTQFTVKSVKEVTGACAYRGENGTKCAVGVFIPDALYCPEMDRGDLFGATDVGTTLECFPGVRQFMPLELEALEELQSIHDGRFKDERSGETIKDQLLRWVEENVSE